MHKKIDENVTFWGKQSLRKKLCLQKNFTLQKNVHTTKKWKKRKKLLCIAKHRYNTNFHHTMHINIHKKTLFSL